MGGHASSMVSTGNEGCASTDTFDGIGGHVCVKNTTLLVLLKKSLSEYKPKKV
jgi:hypothetical protein